MIFILKCLFFFLLFVALVFWVGNFILAWMEMDQREDAMWNELKLESEEQESCQNGGNQQ